MRTPRGTSSVLGMRKELIRLRMEMHRQQLLYHSQPLSKPLHHLQSLVANRGRSSEPRRGKSPLMIIAMTGLALFGRRLGKVGKLARFGLAMYPIVRRLR